MQRGSAEPVLGIDGGTFPDQLLHNSHVTVARGAM